MSTKISRIVVAVVLGFGLTISGCGPVEVDESSDQTAQADSGNDIITYGAPTGNNSDAGPTAASNGQEETPSAGAPTQQHAGSGTSNRGFASGTFEEQPSTTGTSTGSQASASSEDDLITLGRSYLAQGETFPFSFSLPSINNETVSLSDFGGKVVIVDVWGTWCPPCRLEIPHFVELHEKYQAEGLEIVGINYERVPHDQMKSTIQAFVDSEGVPYDCVIGDPETQAKIPNFRGYPTTLFVDRQGNVRMKLVGYTEMEKLEAIVVALLKE